MKDCRALWAWMVLNQRVGIISKDSQLVSTGCGIGTVLFIFLKTEVPLHGNIFWESFSHKPCNIRAVTSRIYIIYLILHTSAMYLIVQWRQIFSNSLKMDIADLKKTMFSRFIWTISANSLQRCYEKTRPVVPFNIKILQIICKWYYRNKSLMKQLPIDFLEANPC